MRNASFEDLVWTATYYVVHRGETGILAQEGNLLPISSDNW